MFEFGGVAIYNEGDKDDNIVVPSVEMTLGQ